MAMILIMADPVEITPSQKGIRLELATVISVVVLSSLIFSIVSMVQGSPEPIGVWGDSAMLLAWSASSILIVVYVGSHCGWPAQAFGLVARIRVVDVLLFLALLIVFWTAQTAVGGLVALAPEAFEGSWWISDYRMDIPQTDVECLAVVVSLFAAALAEELVFRGYLITRLEAVLKSRAQAVFLSSVVFASYHLYQGVSGVTSAFLFGLITGYAWLRYRRLWPLAIMHFAWNSFLSLPMGWGVAVVGLAFMSFFLIPASAGFLRELRRARSGDAG